MSKVLLVYDTPSDASLRYVKCVHSKELGRTLWNMMIKTLALERKARGPSTACMLSEDVLMDQYGSRFLSNQAVQAVYEVGRRCGVDAEVPMSMNELLKDNIDVMGVFYIR